MEFLVVRGSKDPMPTVHPSPSILPRPPRQRLYERAVAPKPNENVLKLDPPGILVFSGNTAEPFSVMSTSYLRNCLLLRLLKELPVVCDCCVGDTHKTVW